MHTKKYQKLIEKVFTRYNMKYLKICPIKKLYDMSSERAKDAAAILCSSYPVRYEKLPRIYSLLILEFDDFTDENRPTAFSMEQAKQIRSFTERLYERITTLYICCDSGESRSAALEAAILRCFGENEMKIWNDPKYHPNPLVYRIQCAAFGRPVSRIGLQYRLWRSGRAFRLQQKNKKHKRWNICRLK